METVTSADGTPIAYERTGSGPPLVLVHGTTADHTRWEPVRPALEEHFSVYAIDRRGRGESGDATEYALEREAEDVSAVVNAIDEPVVLLGHSYGALVSLEAALRTDNLRTLILYEPYLPVSDQKLYSEELLAEMQALEEAGENERLLVLLFEEIVELSPEQMDELRSAPNWPARVNAAHTVYRESDAENEYEFDAARFTDMTTPTVLLSGSESPQSVKDATATVDEGLPYSRIVVLEGQGHIATTTAPELFVDEVLTSIRELSDRTLEKEGLSAETEKLLADVWEFPLFEALFGRRARRFGFGGEIPDGPLQYKSERDPLPLSKLEQSLLIASAVGISGWHFGIPYADAEDGLSTYSLRFTGRPTPTAAGIGTVELFYTDDDGVYFVSTRDIDPEGGGYRRTVDDVEDLLRVCRAHTTTLQEARLDIPRKSPHISGHNLWDANVEGSTLFMPVADVGEQLLSFIIMMARNGITVYDYRVGRYAGELDTYFESGLLDPERKYPLTELEMYALVTNAAELGIMSHNIVLSLQAIGLGGWMFTGMFPPSLMGAFADQGVSGLGFRFQRRDDWAVPNPVGLDNHYESVCPPYHSDMHAATASLVEKKFGGGGNYDPAAPGPYPKEVMETAKEYSEEFVEAVGEMAQYIYDTYGKFPATVPTILMRPLVQAQHLDTDYYDAQFGPESYLDTHSNHLERWHPDEVA